ncbi:hypothetical protein SLEP1_g57056 [Rubroshorea leprosula]|uniref:Uncharacterized protein n=1 Tax=Rubroshorea leprosula TaxID=152421 RepID=A0AAV5MK26_9ROSI|nr:hypothetical protein SLEP1_g57056 [Rubroshorea leprosula]
MTSGGNSVRTGPRCQASDCYSNSSMTEVRSHPEVQARTGEELLVWCNYNILDEASTL